VYIALNTLRLIVLATLPAWRISGTELSLYGSWYSLCFVTFATGVMQFGPGYLTIIRHLILTDHVPRARVAQDVEYLRQESRKTFWLTAVLWVVHYVIHVVSWICGFFAGAHPVAQTFYDQFHAHLTPYPIAWQWIPLIGDFFQTGLHLMIPCAVLFSSLAFLPPPEPRRVLCRYGVHLTVSVAVSASAALCRPARHRSNQPGGSHPSGAVSRPFFFEHR
jgi:hypothetical protein